MRGARRDAVPTLGEFARVLGGWMLLGLVLAAGCSRAPSPADGTVSPELIAVTNEVGPGVALWRYVDEENEAVCYFTDGFYSGGIQCLPLPRVQP